MRSALSISLVLGTTTMACAAQDDAAGAGAEADVTVAQHAQAVASCAKLKAGGSPAEVEQGAANQYACIARANDQTVARIETVLAASSVAGKSKTAFGSHRAAAAKLCGTLVDLLGTSNATDRATQAQCIVERELLLAGLIDAYADLGGTQKLLPEARTDHDDCYRRFTINMALASSDDFSRGQAADRLAQCVTQAALAAKQAIVDRGVKATGRTAAAVQQSVDDAVGLSLTAGDSVCTVLGAASTNRQNGVQFPSRKCASDAAHGVYATEISFAGL